MSQCYCDPPIKDGYAYIPWIGTLMGICAWTPLEVFGVSLGLLNILCWLFAQAPQIYMNFKQKQTEALSLTFLVVWLTGDITNLLGTFLTQQLPIQRYTAIYFCFVDIIILSQWFYYTKFYNPPLPLVVEDQHPTVKKNHRSTSAVTAPLIQPHTRQTYGIIYFLIMYNIITLPLLFQMTASSNSRVESWEYTIPKGRELLQYYSLNGSEPVGESCQFKPELEDWLKVFGDVCAWVSGILYFCARFPQIYLNYERRTVMGLSVTMFVLMNIANICYGTYMLLFVDNYDEKFWISDLPFLVGSFGAVLSNTFILGQWYYYDKYRPRKYRKGDLRDEEYQFV